MSIDAMMDAIAKSEADVVHPGYGFLSESPEFSERVRDAGVCFVGPLKQAMTHLGDKHQLKRQAQKLAIPFIPSSQAFHPRDLQIDRIDMQFPLIVKPVKGGGGRGIALIASFEELEQYTRACPNEHPLILEKFIADARHIEIQVLADSSNTVWTFPERDCTVQRRRQKIIEESPSLWISRKVCEQLQRWSKELVLSAGYTNVCTVEFLVNQSGEAFLMEVNPRIQVEHSVTEELIGSGFDLIEWMFRVAAGEQLPKEPPEIQNMHAIQARVYAEDAESGEPLTVGQIIESIKPPAVRCDIGICEGSRIAPQYDGLLCKLIANGNNRNECISKLLEGLKRLDIAGTECNIRRLLNIFQSESFKKDGIYDFNSLIRSDDTTKLTAASVAKVIYNQRYREESVMVDPNSGQVFENLVQVQRIDDSTFKSTDKFVHVKRVDDHGIEATIEGQGTQILWFSQAEWHAIELLKSHCGPSEAFTEDVEVNEPTQSSLDETLEKNATAITAPMSGLIVKLFAKPDFVVCAGQELFVIEAMKMQTTVRSPVDGVITMLYYSTGQAVLRNQTVCIIKRKS